MLLDDYKNLPVSMPNKIELGAKYIPLCESLDRILSSGNIVSYWEIIELKPNNGYESILKFDTLT